MLIANMYVAGTETGNDKGTMSLLTWWFSKPEVHPIPRIPGVVETRIEPKTYFANERTFLSWLHMALTMGSISAAMLGFSSTKSSSLVSHIFVDAKIYLVARFLN